MTEFELIRHYFQTRAHQRPDVPLGIGDDAALLKPPDNQLLAVTTDTLIEGVHFLPDTSPYNLGHKVLAVSLSDLAAMGAEPAWVVLSLTLPTLNEVWLSAFCDGFFNLSQMYQLQLVGGNTTRGPLSISTYLSGFVPTGQSLQRTTAKPGDLIYVTGTLGDAAAALACLQGKIPVSADDYAKIQSRLEAPTPRVSAGLALRGIATSAIDISDGLMADLGHILKQSGVGATVDMHKIPLSPTLQRLPTEAALAFACNGGDDYELCFTIPPTHTSQLTHQFLALNIPCHPIGTIHAGAGLRTRGNEAEKFREGGYRHF
jgi:thiamine-monophosphate kinase